jgi:hypothetical protein
VTRKPVRKESARRGFKLLSFDEAWPIVLEHSETQVELRKPLSGSERSRLRLKLRSLDNKITPAARQYYAPFESMVRSEAHAWISRHGGMRNISEFIRHFRSLSCAWRVRSQSGKTVAAGAEAIREILKKNGIFWGKLGRPPSKR